MQLGYQELDTRAIAPSPTNPRKHFDEAALAELATSIREQGIIQPIVVRQWDFDEYDDPDPEDGNLTKYEIIAGERRWRAAQLAGLDKIPAIVKDVPTAQVLEIQIIENLQRRDVNELEEADGYRLMMDDHGYTADVLAEKVGKSKAYIYARLKLCDLGPEPRVALINGNISASVALLIARIPTYAMQARATTEVVDGNMSARAAADHIQQRYMLKLSNATWNLADADLCPIAGACIGCPKNTSTDRDQYADVAADVCTDPDCWGNKRAANVAAKAQALMDQGATVITGAKAREWAPRGIDSYYIHNGLQALDSINDGPWINGARVTLRAAYGERLTSLARVWLEDCITGGIIECVKREDLDALLHKLRNTLTPEQAAAQAAAESERQAHLAAEAAKKEATRTYANALYAATRLRLAPNAENPGPWIAPILRGLIMSLLDGDWITDQTMQAYNLPDPDTQGLSHDERATMRRTALRNRLATMTGAELLMLLTDNDCNPAGWTPWQWDDSLLTLEEYARFSGADPDTIRAELEAAQNADAAPPAATQTAETAAPETASTPSQAARAPDLFADEDPKTPAAPAAENQAAQAPASKPAKAKTTPKTTAQAKPKAPAKNPKSSSRASPAGGKGKTTTSTTAKPKKAKEAAA